jgi:hypothetical protein
LHLKICALTRTRHQNIRIPTVIIVAFTFGALATAILVACGNKGPPEPPSGDRPPKVVDLDYSISDKGIKISWTVPKTNEKAKSPATGFLIYRSKQTRIESDCPNCPIRFEVIGNIPIRGAALDSAELPKMVYTETIEAGYRYVYKVRAYDEDGIAGKDSNFVDFSF